MNPGKIFDIAILGAGPAGSTAALSLKNSGLNVILIDKEPFPRDKVCGDAIPARCEKVLRMIDDNLGDRLKEFSLKTEIAGCRVVAPDNNHFDFYFQTRGYCSKRIDFDHFLFSLAREIAVPEILTGFRVKNIRSNENHWEISDGNGNDIRAKTIIGCDGANGVSAKLLTGQKMEPEHHCGAVRAYFSGIRDLRPDLMEIWFPEDFLPGYFWIFPVNDREANVGFGMITKNISAKRVNLKEAMTKIISESPVIAKRFENADQLTEIRGFGLPLGSRKVQLSGEGFLLCGDAGSLIEPATGEGIGNAMLSGYLAARTMITRFGENDFSAGQMIAYDHEVYNRLWKDLRNKYLAQKILAERKWLMNWLVRRAGKKGLVNKLMKKVF